jgi:ADP-ribose pyrophosphatase
MKELYKGDHTQGEIELLEEVVIFQNRFVTHYDDRVKFPGGTEGNYLRSAWNCSYGVGIVPITQTGKIVLVRNFRHGLRDWTWEMVKGFGIEELAPVDCAAKELQEETGFVAEQWKELRALNSEGLILHLYLAQNLSESESNQEVEECISDIGHFDKTAARDLMLSDDCSDPLTMAMLAMFTGDMLPVD